MADHRIDHRNEDYWTEHEKEFEGETGTSVVAGGILVGIILFIALGFALFETSNAPEPQRDAKLQTQQLAGQ